MSFYDRGFDGTNLEKIFNDEKTLIKECIEKITYDEILTETLQRTMFEIDQSLKEGYDCSYDIKIILDTLNSKTYIEGIFSKANDEEKELVNKLKESLLLLFTIAEAEKLPEKESITTEKYKAKFEPKDIQNSSKEHIERYNKMYSKEIDRKNFNKLR